MKIVFASTPGQEEEISALIGYFYTRILPMYFPDNEIREFERLNVLHTESCNGSFGTLRDAFYVMASLQTLILILEAPMPGDCHEALFQKNAGNLREFGLHFPFEYDSFLPCKKSSNTYFSIYSAPANQLLV